MMCLIYCGKVYLRAVRVENAVKVLKLIKSSNGTISSSAENCATTIVLAGGDISRSRSKVSLFSDSKPVTEHCTLKRFYSSLIRDLGACAV